MMYRDWLGLACALLLGGCEQTFRNMYHQPRYKPLAASPVWPDGRASRPEVPGAVARSMGMLAGSSSGRNDLVGAAPAVGEVSFIGGQPKRRSKPGGEASAFHLPPLTGEMLARGRERFDIFCAPCHSPVGDGDGMIPRRGFPHPPSFHTEAMRAASDAQLYAVVTYGYGSMYSYSSQLDESDRVAVVAYIRALQLSQHAPLSAISENKPSRTGAPPGASPAPGAGR